MPLAKRTCLLVFLSLAVVSGAGCRRNAAPAGGTDAPSVEVSVPEHGTIIDYEVFTGRTMSLARVDLKARVTGYLDRVYVGEDGNVPVQERIKEGTDVKKGQKLFVLNTVPFEAAVQQATANREQASETILQQEEQSRYNRSLYDRYQKSGIAASPDDIDKAYSGWKTAEAGAKAARASERSFKSGEDIARQNLEWATIVAPQDGRIGKRFIDHGNVVKADDSTLASIELLHPMGAYFDVDERTLQDPKLVPLLPGGKVPDETSKRPALKLGFANAKPEDFKHDGTLLIADNKVDTNTGTLRMYGTFNNADFNLKSGMFVRVRMEIGGERPALFVSESALGSDQGRKFLWIVDAENKVSRVLVEVGQRKNGLIAIESGLEGNERIVVKGLQRVRAKMEVKPTTVPMPPATIPVTNLPVMPLKNPGR